MNRTVTCAAVVSLGTIGLFSIPSNAADDCLSGPKGATPQGSHWYYHLEKGTGRKCWYLGSQGATIKSNSNTARATTVKPDDTATANEPPVKDQQEVLQPSVANARAELRPTAPAPALTSNAPAAALPAPGLLSGQVSVPAATTSIPGSAQTLASRWPDPDTFKPSPTTQVAQNTVSTPQDNQQRADQQTAPTPAAPQAPVVDANNHPLSAQSINPALTPGRVILAAIFIILAIAAIFARSAFRYFARPKIKVASRRDIWGQADYGEQPLAPYDQMAVRERRRSHAGQPREEADEIEYLLRRAADREAKQRYFSS